MYLKSRCTLILLFTLFLINGSYGKTALDESCVIDKVQHMHGNTTIEEVRSLCHKSESVSANHNDESTRSDTGNKTDGINRIRRSGFLNAYHRNYFMPFSYVRNNNELLVTDNTAVESLNNFESKFQLSFQFNLYDDLWLQGDSLNFAFTMKSYWQSYNREESYPFRESNYEPEFFYAFSPKWWPFKADEKFFQLGLSHQSNGRDRPLSRSWNRLYANMVWHKGNWQHDFKTWWRIPQKRRIEGEPGGDDNPDIEKFMGHFEYQASYFFGEHEFSGLMRHNLRSDTKGALQLEWAFPLGTDRFKGFLQYHLGYGESLLDYDTATERVGLGILLTDLFQ